MSGDLGHELPKRCSRRVASWPRGTHWSWPRELAGPRELPCRTQPWPFWLHLRPAPGSLRRSLPVCSRHADV